MKLSEAMRKGCESTKSLKDSLFDDNYSAACAIGAAYIGRFGDPRKFDGDWIMRFREEFEKELMTIIEHPERSWEMDRVEILIMLLNDMEDWTREEIADWLEEIGF